MVQGLREKTGSRVCVSVTGIAGPGGGTPEKKPVGLIYIGCIFDGRTEIKEIRMRNVNRTGTGNYAVLSMLDMVNRMIEGRDNPLTNGRLQGKLVLPLFYICYRDTTDLHAFSGAQRTQLLRYGF